MFLGGSFFVFFTLLVGLSVERWMDAVQELQNLQVRNLATSP